MSILPLPVPVRTAWVCGEDIIDKGSMSIVLAPKQVDKSVACLLQPFLRSHPLVGFATVFTSSPIVAPLYPTVSGLTFPDCVIEGVPIEFARVLFPPREGPSQVYIERARFPSSDWVGVAQLDVRVLKYTPSRDDVDFFLRISYTPATLKA
jgi:hypothetical protein